MVRMKKLGRKPGASPAGMNKAIAFKDDSNCDRGPHTKTYEKKSLKKKGTVMVGQSILPFLQRSSSRLLVASKTKKWKALASSSFAITILSILFMETE